MHLMQGVATVRICRGVGRFETKTRQDGKEDMVQPCPYSIFATTRSSEMGRIQPGSYEWKPASMNGEYPPLERAGLP
jgi:hypothetical protein